jgi:phospholipase/carboxylesterase
MGVPIGRRSVLKMAMASGTLACRNDTKPPIADDWGGLDVAKVGRMREDERGGTAIVLLHGWGASGDDLVPLAEVLASPRARFFVPAAPLPEMGGRAWWHLDAKDRPQHACDGEMPAGYQPNRQVSAVRTAIRSVLRTIRARYAPDTLVLGGFSQGGMLSLDVALAADPPVDRVLVLSGSLLADSLAGLSASRPSRPRVFMSHGRRDHMLPFQGADQARATLERHGFDVTWHPFDGDHEIPSSVVQHVREFLFAKTD